MQGLSAAPVSAFLPHATGVAGHLLDSWVPSQVWTALGLAGMQVEAEAEAISPFQALS